MHITLVYDITFIVHSTYHVIAKAKPRYFKSAFKPGGTAKIHSMSEGMLMYCCFVPHCHPPPHVCAMLEPGRIFSYHYGFVC
jgi:hypothetical protein